MSDSTPRSQELRIPSLARVEGETALHLRIHDGTVIEAQLKIYEPPRFFEAFLRGRAHTEPPDLTSRICGICPVAYQMSACRAIEDACGVVVDGQLAALRRLLYCGEWIESQTLHIHMLHAPDFLGEDDVIGLPYPAPGWGWPGWPGWPAYGGTAAALGKHPIGLLGSYAYIPTNAPGPARKEFRSRF
ncbi:nickel-dependent hydrogenase large subunit, partial [Streptomyces sp. NPDC041003]|uniref:nickel-dependent hydrogenase large subunit n=1 Tax=Streptomyces sp. NPDC041003 TaxID=3155730 RepID=UPI0033EF1181